MYEWVVDNPVWIFCAKKELRGKRYLCALEQLGGLT